MFQNVTILAILALFVVFRARVRAVLFFSPKGSRSVVAYHAMSQRSQSVDSRHTGPIGGDVDKLGPILLSTAAMPLPPLPNHAKNP